MSQRLWAEDPKKLLEFRINRLIFDDVAIVPDALGGGKIVRTSQKVFTVLHDKKPCVRITIKYKRPIYEMSKLVVSKLCAMQGVK